MSPPGRQAVGPTGPCSRRSDPVSTERPDNDVSGPRRRRSPLAVASVAAAVLIAGGGGAYWAAAAAGDGAAD
ncbi:hypothetical protein ACTU45_00865, partial [Streptomyces sp. 24-1644]